ncbi:MAG: hypothetical protein ACLTVY_11835, partial [Faecalibacterium sp.]
MLGRIVLHRIRQAINEQAQLENYKKLAYADSLTGLFNYTAFWHMKSRWPERTDWTYIVMTSTGSSRPTTNTATVPVTSLLWLCGPLHPGGLLSGRGLLPLAATSSRSAAAATDEDVVKAVET